MTPALLATLSAHKPALIRALSPAPDPAEDWRTTIAAWPEALQTAWRSRCDAVLPPFATPERVRRVEEATFRAMLDAITAVVTEGLIAGLGPRSEQADEDFLAMIERAGFTRVDLDHAPAWCHDDSLLAPLASAREAEADSEAAHRASVHRTGETR
jgi:hypothetical protein